MIEFLHPSATHEWVSRVHTHKSCGDNALTCNSWDTQGSIHVTDEIITHCKRAPLLSAWPRHDTHRCMANAFHTSVHGQGAIHIGAWRGHDTHHRKANKHGQLDSCSGSPWSSLALSVRTHFIIPSICSALCSVTASTKVSTSMHLSMQELTLAQQDRCRDVAQA